MDLEKNVTLHNGVSMPLLGLGTTHNGGYHHPTVKHALSSCDYRLIDTAKRYGTEAYVGQAVKDVTNAADSNLDRSDLFLTTKLWPSDYGSRDTVLRALSGSLERLGTDYLDLYLLHWPDCHGSVVNKRECLEDTWRAMELMLESGRCRAIGVSNFLEHHLEPLLEQASVAPHVNQCEFHPYQNPLGLREYCRENRIQFQGYCPLGKGQLLTEPPVVKVADKLKVSPAQVLIRWSVQNGVVTIPKSTKKQRVWENSRVFSSEFALPESDMAILDNLCHEAPSRKIIDLSRMQATINSDLPDGYKLARSENSFPESMTRSENSFSESMMRSENSFSESMTSAVEATRAAKTGRQLRPLANTRTLA